jgi:hypothetical protein
MSSANNIRYPEELHSIRRQLGDRIYQNSPHRSIYGQFKKSIKHLEIMRKQKAETQRFNFLDQRIQQAIIQNKTTVAAAISKVKKIEYKLRSFKTIRRTTKPQTSTGLTHIFHEVDTTIERVDEPSEMERILHLHFRNHFNQATGTPFTVGVLRETFGYGGHNTNTQYLLDGKLQLSEDVISTEMKWLLSNFRRSRPPISAQFPAQDIQSGFLKWRESTSTSPSGKHLGIYRSIILAKNNNLHTKQDIKNETTLAEILFLVQVLLINLAIRGTHSYTRWHTVHNFAIEKIPGYPLVQKLRVIHLVEADWNLILKYFTGRQVLRAAVNAGTATYEQAGGRPKRRAVDEVVQTMFNYETCNLQRLFGGVTYNDAKSCYDRIPENLANMSAIKEGLPQQLAVLHSTTMSHMKYHLKHQFGVAPTPNQHGQNHQFHGAGQGSGDAPARWGFISNNAIVTYNQHSTPAQLISPITKIHTDKRFQASVDDATQLTIVKSFLLFAALNATLKNTQL